jgi:hypothetical protein
MVRQLRYFLPLALSSALLLAAFASSASAQRRGRGGLRPGEVSLARLLTIEAVQNELKLSDKQKAAATEINNSLTEERHKLFAEVSKDSHERTKKVADLEERTAAKVKKLLDEPQQKRLREILIQVNVASELMKKDIQEELHITPEQRKKLIDVNRANSKARHDALASHEGDKTAKMLELQREADKKLLAVLTDTQREQFEKLKGKKISLDLFKT